MIAQRALLIVNRGSQAGDADLTPAIEWLESQGLSLIKAAAETPEALADTISRHSDSVDLIIVGGGDGTLNAAAQALVRIGLPLGILPLGTANDLARTLQIPAALSEACKVLIEGKPHPIDLGWVNGHYFFNVAHIGLGAGVTHAISRELKQRWGAFGYARAVLSALRDHRPFSALIRCDGTLVRSRCVQITVGNGRHYGGGMTLVEDAAIDDQRLDLYYLKPRRWWELLAAGLAIKTGRLHRQQGVHVLHGREIGIHTRRHLPVSADGELVTHTPALFRVVPRALSILVPAHYPS